MTNILNVPMSNGWASFDESLAIKQLYISNDGNDVSNDGLSESSPFFSLQKALEVTDDNSFTIINLMRGNRWNLTGVTINKSGQSWDKPLMIKTYGSGPRPICTFSGNGLDVGTNVKNVCILDIDFDPVGMGIDNIYSEIHNNILNGQDGYEWANKLASPIPVCDVIAVKVFDNENVMFENCNFLQCCVAQKDSSNVLYNRCNFFEDFSRNGGTVGSAIQSVRSSGTKIHDSFIFSPRGIKSADDYKDLTFWNKSIIVDDSTTGFEVTSSLIGFNKDVTVVDNRVFQSNNVFLAQFIEDISLPVEDGYATIGSSVVLDDVKIGSYLTDNAIDSEGNINVENFYLDKRISLDRGSWDSSFSTENLLTYTTGGVVESSASSESSATESSSSSESMSSESSSDTMQSSESSESASSDSSESASSDSSESPVIDPEIRWVNPPEFYEKGSLNKIEFELIGDIQGEYDFLSICWHNDLRAMVDNGNMGIDYPHTIDGPPEYSGPPYYLDNNKLDLIPEGFVNLQVMFRLRDPGSITTIQTLKMNIDILPAEDQSSESSASSESSMSSESSNSSVSSSSDSSESDSSQSSNSSESASSISSVSSISSTSSVSSISSESSISSDSSSSESSVSSSSNSSTSSDSSESNSSDSSDSSESASSESSNSSESESSASSDSSESASPKASLRPIPR